MGKYSLFLHSSFLKTIFTISFFLLLFISSISYNHTKSLKILTELLVHSYKIQIQLEQLLSYVKDAETGQRGYIITNDSTFLDPYIRGREKVNKSFIVLKELIKNQPKQQANLQELRHLIDARFIRLANSLASISAYGTTQLLGENMVKGKEIMDSIRSLINQMIDLEISYFNSHQAKYNREISFTPFITLLLLLFSLLIIILSFLKINQDLNNLKDSNEKLLITTESIKHAEIIGEFCTSIWDMKANKLIYSDNLYRLLGCEPQSFEPTIDNYLEFIHPDDKSIISRGARDILFNHDTYPHFYRVIRKDDKQRYFQSMGKFIGNSTHISVIKDVTEAHLSSLVLEERNRELEQSNKELAYFNQIASHDLQEPLRKIQTFISLLTTKESSALSEVGKDYFSRIQTSANRMRKLIDDLLLFSRTNKIDKSFEETDLNLILKNVLLELSTSIEEKRADIKSDLLPVLKVIPFQIYQLFQNLISNSLKYSKPDVLPFINFNCEKITAKSYPILKTSSNNVYYKISVKDNGLGFEQQYAEKIFTIFKRLHTSAEYPGTGMGLSICKKIVENHSGFIFAEGWPGIGSVFTIFLPAE